ncbi:MAG: RloB family protein [Firmicutes bacterium]|nr:RloB family protein [Bacillota bacterium]
MGTDDIFKKRKGKRKIRKESHLERKPYRYLIVCEGGKTEPNYFEGIKRKIELKYKDYINVITRRLEIEIVGTGRNTEDLVKYAIKERSLSEIPYGHTWVIFDKDSFSEKQFNNAIREAIDNDINVGWSNESIELWFLLHFEFLNTGISRQQYIKKLSNYFTKFDINKGKYEKNMDNIFEVLMAKGDVQSAIKWSEKLIELHKCENRLTESAMNPGTTVYKLVSELMEYF